MPSKNNEIKVIELFAGVGGFRLGLEGHPDKKWHKKGAGNFKTVWANQWEPPGSEARQFAFRCYQQRFDPESKNPEKMSNEDINEVLNKAEKGEYDIPDCNMIVGGFPCQDYSVAKTLSQAGGIEGKKGVLWWDIYRLIKMKEPKYLLLENVDRLLKSPASQRGRDFAIMLSCLNNQGYLVEWRVINAAEYGLPQKRRRTYIYAELQGKRTASINNTAFDLKERMLTSGVLAEAFPLLKQYDRDDEFSIPTDIMEVSDTFGIGDKTSKFQNAGVMKDGRVFTARSFPKYRGKAKTLGSVLIPEDDVPKEFYIDKESLKQWKHLKGSKSIDRVSKSGHKYKYSEGSMAFPDLLENPARTILTGEGGKTPSRFKHIIKTPEGKWRRLVPDELDQLQCFPKGWTAIEGMTDGNRAFCMGNALVVDIPERIGKVIAKRNNEE